MKNYRIACVVSGHSEYDDELQDLLSTKVYPQICFTEFDHLDLADCFILAGADIRSSMVKSDNPLVGLRGVQREDEVQVEMFIDAEDKADFLTRLDSLIEEKYASLGRYGE